MSVSKTEIVTYVKLYGATDYDPTVSDADIDTIVERYRLEDDTFDHSALNGCTADVWDLKAGRTANFHDMSVNGRGISASQVKAHCEERAKWFRRRSDVQVA